MSQTGHHSWLIKLETFRYINVMTLHSLVSRVGDHNMGRFRGVKRIGRDRGVEKTGRKIK